MPIHVLPQAPEPGLPGLGHHLGQGRVGEKGIGQPAGIVCIGAGQLHGGRGGGGFAVAAIPVEGGGDAVGESRGRIEAVEFVVPGELAAELVA
jgi:hypothetical protein